MYLQVNDKKYPCAGYTPMKLSAVFTGVEGLTLPISGEISLAWTDDDGNNHVLIGLDCGKYAKQFYVENILKLSNEPEPAALTVDELRAAALARISGKCKTAIMSGVTVSSKHYTLTELDQVNLNAAVALANAGTSAIPFAADREALTMYTADQIKAIGTAAYQWGVANQIYYALLQAWIARETDSAVLPTIDYGKVLPSDLTAALTAQLTAAGINTAALASLLN